MSRDYKVYLEDIFEALEKIERFTVECSFEQFTADEMLVDAVVKNLEVIGEATKNVPNSIRLQTPEIDWRKIAGLRDILVHAYFSIDLEVVWDILKNKLPELKKRIQSLLEPTSS